MKLSVKALCLILFIHCLSFLSDSKLTEKKSAHSRRASSQYMAKLVNVFRQLLIPGPYNPIDIVIVLDASSDLSPSDYICAKKTAYELAKLLNSVSPLGINNTLIGLVQYTSTADIFLGIHQGSTLTNVFNALNPGPVPLPGTETRTEKGINQARLMLKNGGRPDAQKLIYVMANGNSAPIDPSVVANYTKNQLNAEIYAVPLRDTNINQAQLLKIVSAVPADHFIAVESFCYL